MAQPTDPTPTYAIGAGVLLDAPIGTTEPTNTVVGSVFTDDWPAGWAVLGMTSDGHVFNYQPTFNPIEAAESADPIAIVSEGRASTIVFSLMSIIAAQWARAFNGGSSTTTGATTTKLTTFEPPDLGQEVRRMLGWQSTDGTERLVARQCIQTGQVSITRNKGAGNKAVIPCEFTLELPATGAKIFKHALAGPRA